MMNRRNFLIAALALLAACSQEEQPRTAQAIVDEPNAVVVASNYPLYYAALRLLDGIGNAPDIVFPDIDGDPAYWVPDAEQIALLQSADLIILNGAGAESWLNLVTLEDSRLFDTTAELADRLIPLANDVQHQHGPEGEHTHDGTAFTTWLDSNLYAAQTRALGERLATLVPGDEDRLQLNLAAFESDLAALDRELESAIASLNGRPVLFSHPVYQYLERRYGLPGRSLHWEPDVEPSTADWIELQELRDEYLATLMIWEGEPLPETRARLASAGMSIMVFEPAANRPGDGDYMDVMRANLGNIVGAP